MLARHAGGAETFEHHRRVDERVAEDPDRGILDLDGGEPPALRTIGSSLGDQRRRDVVAIAAAVLDGVRWGEPLALSIGQQTC